MLDDYARQVARRFERAFADLADLIRERCGLDELERDIERATRDGATIARTYEAARLRVERTMALTGRPPLVARQYVRPRWARRACGGRWRVRVP